MSDNARENKLDGTALAMPANDAPRYFEAVEALVDHVIERVGKHIVLGIPLGIGKPNQFVNALYRRVAAQPDMHLTILTALSLEKPRAGSELEQRFIEPFARRVFGDYPDLDYVLARRGQGLPPNVRVTEFFLKTGDYLENDIAQQDFISSNYTNAARDMLLQGVNVLAQAVAVEDCFRPDRIRLSLSGNPDITLDMLDLLKAQEGRSILKVACYNRKLPFMENDAVVAPQFFDCILRDPGSTHDLFAPPNMKVSLADYAIGLYASALVKDGGTLQIGIGSLGDAIAHSLIVREHDNANYVAMLQDLHALPEGSLPAMLETTPFVQGLYGCSEMFVNGFVQLLRHGILRREVFDDLTLQTLLNEGKLSQQLRPDTLYVLQQAGVFGDSISAAQCAWLCRFGIFKHGVSWQEGRIFSGEQRFIASRFDLAQLTEHCLGTHLQQGVFLHAGFFLGPRDFYSALHALPPEVREKIGMSRISRVNSILGHEALARLQRRDARFINTSMKVSLLGAASSDSLDSGRVVSGVGGQFNFVDMADALPDARSILMLRATHARHGNITSNIVNQYAQTTVPRHLRDIVITEYGIADLRGQTDSQCVERMLAVTDARFQDELAAQAKASGKLRQDYVIPPHYRRNTRALLEGKLRRWREQGCLPDFPFGTDFTEDEIVIVKALQKLKASSEHPLDLLKVFLHSFGADEQSNERYLARMQLGENKISKELDGIKLRLLRRLFVGNLS